MADTSEVDWDAVAKAKPAAPSGEVDWDAVAAKGKAPAPAPTAGPIRRRTHEAMEGVRRDFAGPKTTEEMVTRGLEGPTIQAVQQVGDLANVGLAAFGGGVEKLVHGAGLKDTQQLPPWLQLVTSQMMGGRGVQAAIKQPGKVAGDVAQVTGVPGLSELEAFEALSNLQRVSRAAREEGVSMARARELVEGGWLPKRVRETKRSMEAAKRLGGEAYPALSMKGLRKPSGVLSRSLLVGSPLRSQMEKTQEVVHGTTGKLAQAAAERAVPLKTAREAEAAGKTPEVHRFTPAAAGGRVKEGAAKFVESDAGARAKLAGASPKEAEVITSSLKRQPVRYSGFSAKAQALYDDADRAIGPLNRPISVSNTKRALGGVGVKRFSTPGLGAVAGEDSFITRLRTILEGRKGLINFEDVRTLRTQLREDYANALKKGETTLSTRDVDGIYEALSRDLDDGAEKLGAMWHGKGLRAGETVPGRNIAQARSTGGYGARRKWELADKYYAAGQKRRQNVLAKIYGPNVTESQVFANLVQDLQAGRGQDLKNALAVKRSLSPEDWQAFASGVLDNMGRAPATGETEETPFNINTFLTNFNKMNEPVADIILKEGEKKDPYNTGLKVLFEGAYGSKAPQVLRDLRTVASNFRELERGRAIASGLPETIAGGSALGVGYAVHNPLGAVATVLVGNAASMLLASPEFLHFLARLPKEGSEAEVQSAMRKARAWVAATGQASGMVSEGQAEQGNEGHPLPDIMQAQPPPAQPAPSGGAGMIGQ